MQKFYHKCAALLLAVGLLFPGATALAQMPEEGSMAVGLSSVDSGMSQAPDNGYESGSAITYTSPKNDFYTTTRADWALDALPKPKIVLLWVDGNADTMREFAVRWNQSDYDAGMASGAEHFTITGNYVPANAEDQALWDKDLLRVDETSVPKMEVLVTNATALPFKVELGRDEAADGYYPIFAFPLPYGASEVRFEASEDGTHWFTCVETYNNVGGFTVQNTIYSMQYAIYTEDGEPFFFDVHKKSYYRVTVYGSAYDASGCGAQSTYTLNAVPEGTNPPGSSLDDVDGNRGGGTQGETDRPGKEPEKEPPKELVPAQNGVQKPSLGTTTPIVALPENASLESGAVSAKSMGSGADIAEHTLSASRDPSAQETLASSVEESLAAEPPPPDKGNAGAVAATTAAILVAGAGGVYLFKIRRKP